MLFVRAQILRKTSSSQGIYFIDRRQLGCWQKAFGCFVWSIAQVASLQQLAVGFLTFLPQSQFRWTWKPIIFLKETIIFDPFYLLFGRCHDSCKQKRVKAAVWILLLVVKETQWVWSSWGEFVFYLRFEDRTFWLYFLLDAWFFLTSNWVSEVASAYCFSCSFMFHLCSCQCLSEKVVSVWLAGGCEDHHTRAHTHVIQGLFIRNYKDPYSPTNGMVNWLSTFGFMATVGCPAFLPRGSGSQLRHCTWPGTRKVSIGWESFFVRFPKRERDVKHRKFDIFKKGLSIRYLTYCYDILIHYPANCLRKNVLVW